MPTNNNSKLFEKQQKVYPKRVWGKYRKIKWLLMFITLGIYYLAPWVRWDRGFNAPDQAILIDIPNSRAYFFFIEIWPQEVYYITGLLIIAAVGLFFVTSLFGRAWCGYICPQTVWTDLFVWVERIFQGDRQKRMKLDQSSLSFNKFWRKLATHLTWIFIGLITGGAWVFYYNDAPTLMSQILNFDVPWSVTGWIIALTGSTYLLAGFGREQVCNYMCPYARFQSAMFDEKSLIICYDESRGEPRSPFKKGTSWQGRGHCIDCKICVHVCPAGIDIRNGLQMECIACGMCIDACNNVMDKLSLPRGLVRYDTELNQKLLEKNREKKINIWRKRTIFYLSILLITSSIMFYGLNSRSPIELHVLHDRNPMFVQLKAHKIRNGYDIKILNKTHEDKVYALTVSGLERAEIKVLGAGNISPENLKVFADSVGHFRVFLTSYKQEHLRQNLTFYVEDVKTKIIQQKNSIFVSGKE
ncbi:MAG: cytochrome c oxidase accessory protein CcoG [Candidatus Thioglobus sp.]|nr:cytochrome c oxidase accessory protein CcoG [Candidatus Thioglobus sp.]